MSSQAMHVLKSDEWMRQLGMLIYFVLLHFWVEA